MRWIPISALAALLATPALAWDMNTDINATNFIVADQCSGTLISLKYKLILTNDHCTTGYVDSVEKEETAPDGEVKKVTREVFKDMALKQKSYQGFREVGSASFQSTILFHKKRYDLALLQIRADTIPQTIFSHILPDGKTVTRGDTVWAVGNPLMLDATLTKGIVSSVTRTFTEENEDIPFIQTDSAINPGNSGGALYNTDGELIGVPARKIAGGSGGLGFAIPYTLIRTFLSENCYEDVWNDKAIDHDTCVKTKLDEKNIARAKAGLPPLKEEPKPQSTSYTQPMKKSWWESGPEFKSLIN